MKISLSLIMNTLCTNNCKYCYQKRENKIISKDVIFKTIDTLKNHDLLNDEIEFFGGEPMLNANLINEIVQELPDYHYSIITNGFFLNYDDYLKYLVNLKNVKITISLEINKASHMFYRNNSDDYEKMFQRIIKLKKLGFNISVNSSINKEIFENLDESILRFNQLSENHIGVHFYTIKGSDGFESLEDIKSIFSSNYSDEYFEFIKQLFNISKEFLESDSQYLCSFDDKLTIYPNGDIISCQWDNTILANVLNFDLNEFKEKYSYRLALNHKDLYPGCSTCDVPVGICTISCVPYIINLLETDMDKLICKCEIQKFIHNKRKELIL